jgi:hypothetical protein
MSVQPTAVPIVRELEIVQSQPAVSGDHVIFYSETGFRGESFIVETGAEVEDLRQLPRQGGSWSNAISSFRIVGVATVVAYAESDFRGPRLETSSSLRDLVAERPGGSADMNWDNAITSLRVVAPRARVFEPAPIAAYDRRTAETIVQRAYRDILGRNPDQDGLRSYREKLMDQGWSEEDVRDHIRRSEESRAINPDEVITKAYRETLKRDPDPEGLRHYRDLLVNHAWTIPQIRADLLRSEEARANPDEIITKAYREVLRREPDPEGMRHYRDLITNHGWTVPQVRADLLRSDEWRANPEDVITKAYRDVLKREPDPEGMRHYRDLIANHGWTIAQLRADLLRSDERSDKRVREVITKAYVDLLGREPDPNGFATYQKAILEKGWSEKQVRDDIARSPEARAHRAK